MSPAAPSSSHFRTIERQDSFDLGCEPIISCGRVGCIPVVRPQPRTRSLDVCSSATLSASLSEGEASFVDPAAPSDLLMAFSQAKTDTGSTSGFDSAPGREENSARLKKLMDNAESPSSRGSLERFMTVSDTISPADINGYTEKAPVKRSNDGSNSAPSRSRTDSADQDPQGLLSVHVDQALMSRAPVSEGDSGIEPCAEGGEDDGRPASPAGSQASKSAQADVTWTPAEQTDKKKGDFFFFFFSRRSLILFCFVHTEKRLGNGTLCCR